MAIDARLPLHRRWFATCGFPWRLAELNTSTAPQDAFERERLDNVRPPDWCNPQPADRYGLVVIGSGTARQVAAYEAPALGARVAVIEHGLFGGNCLNVGCVPSKSIIRPLRLYAEMRNAEQYGAQVP